MKVLVREATEIDLDDLTALALLLWPDEDEDDLGEAMAEIVESPTQVAFVAIADGIASGFATASVRADYVEGSDSSPVGYLEGVYTDIEHRRQGIARSLVRAIERWVAMQGCTEFGSDAYLNNAESHAFHRAVGFEEAAQLVAFIKQIDDADLA